MITLRRLFRAVVYATVVTLLAGCTRYIAHSTSQQTGYFDPHTHLSGVLPWPAYADLPAYISKLKGKGAGVTKADKRAFYTWLADTWYPEHRDAFGDQPFSSAMRYGLGARAAIELYPPQPDMDSVALNGALERIFTATPFTVFDNAYAFHGPAYTWLTAAYYDNDRRAGSEDLCTAQILELARTHITRSEQSISFIGGWGFDAKGRSYKLATIRCAARKPGELKETLAHLDEPVPRVHIILMTHTDQLARNKAGDAYRTFESTGKCHQVPLAQGLKLSPEQMYYALMGEDKQGKRIYHLSTRKTFFNTLVGIDTAAPEMTCFTDAGMTYYRHLVDAVYRAAKARRAIGWEGKLLVHTHVGEGFAVYYGKQPPREPWSFDSVFARLPALDGNVITNAEAPRDNITMLLNAVAAVRKSHPDLDRYIEIRFGHLTHATLAQAHRMAHLHIEADINLDSNIATGAWSFSQMPDSAQLADRAARAAADPLTNFELNNLPAFLIPDPNNVQQAAGVLGTHPLKYLLMAHVRIMLGTDGAGVEHSSMPREYALAASLIHYWKAHDPAFERAAGAVSTQAFFNNAHWHLANMASNRALPY
jgi:hypothetical protein